MLTKHQKIMSDANLNIVSFSPENILNSTMESEKIKSSLSSSMESMQPVLLKGSTSTDLREYFQNTWDLYELLFSALKSDDAYFESPDKLRNPLIFYWGHTAAFYINKLKMAGLIDSGIQPDFEVLFARGVDPDLPENLDIHSIWPSVQQVSEYRNKVYELVLSLINEFPDYTVIDQDSPWWSLLMSIEHDRIHLEASSVLIRQLDTALLNRPFEWNYAPTQSSKVENRWIQLDSEEIQLGKDEQSESFGWDNEYGQLQLKVPAFEVQKYLITNEEYMGFVLSGNYENKAFWSDEGWEWKERDQAHYPRFWVPEGSSYRFRAMFDVIEMPLQWPVEVNAHEALAFCLWKGKEFRLMTEAEFKVLAQNSEQPSPNNHLRFGSPAPVGYAELNPSSAQDVMGNVWDWLSNDFYPLPGFKVHPLYEDFSEPYFDEEHGMMAGGSWITTGTGANQFYRLWFRRHFYQHAGFRLARSVQEE